MTRLVALALTGWLAATTAACTTDNTAAPTDDAQIIVDPTVDAAVQPVDPDAGAVLPHCNATDPRSLPTTIAVLPDQGEAPYVDVINRAQRTLRVMVYIMGRGGIMDALKAKAAAGVDVRMILDGETQRMTNQRYFDELTAAGVHVVWSDPKFPYMHAKTILADSSEATISTGNYSLVYSIQSERNFVARVTDPADLADMTALFDADYERRDPDMSCTRLLISPINARGRILDLIRSARRTLDIESMQLADSDVRVAIAERSRAGVVIRAVLAPSSWIEANAAAATFLTGIGATARWMERPNVHVKALVVDGTAAYAGSENFSFTSLSRNREVGVILTEAAAVKTISDTFERDYAVATPF